MIKLSESTLYKTPIFDLVSKEFTELNFNPVGINTPDWVTVIAHDKTDTTKIIVVDQYRYGLEDNSTEFICGTVEPNEDPAITALREFEEETGIKVDLTKDKLTSVAEINPNPAIFNNKMHIYYLGIDDLPTRYNERGSQKLDPNEDCTTRLVDYNEILPCLRKNAMQLAALYYYTLDIIGGKL